MVNLLKKQVCKELTGLFQDIDDCVMVDFNGLSVQETNTFRSSLTESSIRMQVVKASLTNIVLKEMGQAGFEELLRGPTAVVWGGDGIIQVSKSINDFAKKTKRQMIKGGILDSKVIDKDMVKKLTTIPDMPILYGSIAYAIASPIQQIATGINSILGSIANLVDALHDKKKEDG